MFSAHSGCLAGPAGVIHCDYTEHLYWGSVEYPTVQQTYTRVYVANRKHANYATRSKCNSGALFGADNCAENVDDQRLTIDINRNVGSFVAPLLNARYSATPGTYPGTEYFWQDVRFCGWHSPSVAREECSPTSYYDFLMQYLLSGAT